jgi:hypothetical protein
MFNLLLANDLERYACPGPWEPSGPDDRFALCETVGEGLSQCLTRVLAEEVPRLLLAFRASMDQGKLHVLADCRANSVRAYNWLFGMEQGSITAGLGKKRLQAATAYPVAWPLISMTTGPVCDAIGEPQPLIPALAKTLGTTERVVRLLNGLSAESAGVVGMPTLGDLERIVAQMDLMPQGSAPRTPNGRMSFLRIIPLAALVAGIRYRRATKENITEVLSTCGDAWDTLVPDEITSAAACFSDAISDLSDQVVAPAERNRFGLIGEEALVDTGKIFVGERGIAAILKACLWWQEHRMELHAHLAGRHPSPFRDAGSSTNQWPPLHKGPPWKTSTDLLIQALCSDAELKREAAVMSHCVDNYAQSCLWTGVHIVSVRGIDGVPIATAEFDPGILSLAGKQPDLPNSMITELPPCVRQFRGRQNNEPPRLAWQALWEYVGGLCAGRIPVDSKELAADLERRQRAKRRLHTQFSGGDVALDLRCVYDAMSTEGILEAWRCYGPMLPRNTARRGPWRAIENARASRNPVAASTPSNELPVDPDANADRPIPRAA